jgi:AraC-like DNA-binding protein
MAAVAGTSEHHFLRVFWRLTGVTPHQYLISARLRGALLWRRPLCAQAV